MIRMAKLLACSLVAACAFVAAASAQASDQALQSPEMDRAAFPETVTVSLPGKTIYLAGVGAEDESGAAGTLPSVRHLGNVYEQCKYSYDKIKRLLRFTAPPSPMRSNRSPTSPTSASSRDSTVPHRSVRQRPDSGEHIPGRDCAGDRRDARSRSMSPPW